MISKAKYPINFTESGKQFALRLHYNGSDNVLFVNAIKMYLFKAKDLEIKPNSLRLGTISKDFSLDHMKKGLKGEVKVFSVDYNPINTSNTLDILRF